MKEKGFTQADLIRKSGLPKTTVSRICRNNNDKGMSYQPSPIMVMTLCVVLGLSAEESKMLFHIAFPEWPVWKEILEQRLTMYEANVLLHENGLPMLGKVSDE